jgi:Fe2+ or Zn2+ uptake regulation protein
MKARTTRQMAAVREVLASARDHPTAEVLFARVRDRVPRVSLGTIYRNLDKLREQGRVRVLRLDGGEAHFDGRTEAHDHFVCVRCGAVRDLPGAAGAAPADEARAAGCVVHWRTTAYYGHCGDCATAPGTGWTA